MAAAFPFIARLGTGGFASGYSSSLAPDDGTYAVATVGGRAVRETSKVGTFKRPAQPLELYEFQSCPFCRKVREAISVLDLDVLVYPCPKGGVTWRPKAVELGGKAQFPYLVDPNTGKAMYESDAIVGYLFSEYGDGSVPLPLRLGAATTVTCGLALAPR
jgi:glutaredoxin